jgi:hypothetical protein
MQFQIICLNETCLNDNFYHHKLFPISLTTVRSDTVSSTKRGAAVLRAVPSSVATFNAGVMYSFMTYGLGRNSLSKCPQFTDW